MSQKNKQILMNGLELLFLLLSFIFLSLPVLRINSDTMYYNDLNIFNLMYNFSGDFNSSVIATTSLFIVLLTFLSLFTIIPNTILLVVSNNNFKVFNTIKNTFLSLLLLFYVAFLIVFALLASSPLGGIVALTIYLVVVLVTYFVVRFSVKVVNIDNKPSITCPSCGKNINKDSKFCANCGYNLTNSLICSNCGAHLKEDDVYCTRCGKRVN